LMAPRPTPNLEDQFSLFVNPEGRVAQCSRHRVARKLGFATSGAHSNCEPLTRGARYLHVIPRWLAALSGVLEEMEGLSDLDSSWRLCEWDGNWVPLNCGLCWTYCTRTWWEMNLGLSKRIIDRWMLKWWEEYLYHFHFVSYSSHMDYLRIEFGLLREKSVNMRLKGVTVNLDC
jgi:hypothetical protein